MTSILLIGSGEIAHHYVVALRQLGYFHIDVLSRTIEGSTKFGKTYELHNCFGGGISTLPSIVNNYSAIILASPIETLLPYVQYLVNIGFPRILVEKPLVLNSSQLALLLEQTDTSSVMVALNRLFYPSYCKLFEISAIDPIRSVDFSFTEWIHRIQTSKYSRGVLQKWGVSNCIHVISTVFDLIGQPRSLSSLVEGPNDIPWHPTGSIFKGFGISAKAIPFSYSSDWRSAGRWSITASTSSGSYHLEPMESLDFTKLGTLGKKTIVPAWDSMTKCGFVPMLDYWLNTNTVHPRYSLPTLCEHIRTIEYIMYSPRS